MSMELYRNDVMVKVLTSDPDYNYDSPKIHRYEGSSKRIAINSLSYT